MKFVTSVTQSGIARAMASALVLAVVLSSTGFIMAAWGPERFDLTVKVYNGDPANFNMVSGAALKLTALDAGNPDNGVQGTSDSNGNYLFRVHEGRYTLEVSHPDFYTRDFFVIVDADGTYHASVIPKETIPDPNPPGPTPDGGCLPTPPRGQPMLNIWPIANTGAPCTDYPLLSAKNANHDNGYLYNTTINAAAGEIIRFRVYVHNGTLDFPENEAFNVIAKVNMPTTMDSATIAAEAWANNADRISSSHKGGNVTINMASDESLEYIPGSTKLFRQGAIEIPGGSDSVITTGQSLGNMRGCFEFLRFITFEARVKKHTVTPPPTPTPVPPPTPTPVPPPPAPTPGVIAFEKLVRNVTDNQTSFVKSTTAEFGETVEFQLKTTITNTVHNITVSDVLPNRLTYVNNSLTINDAAAGNNLGSIVIGTATNTTKIVKFRAVVADSVHFPVGQTTLTNVGNVTSSVGNATDHAFVVVNKVNPPQAAINLDKVVRNVSDNQATFADSTNADPGEQVEFQLRVTASGSVNNITLNDVLPNRLTYVDNSLRVDGAAAGNNLSSIVLGNMTTGTKNVTFRATVAASSQFSEGNTTLTNTAHLNSSAGNHSDTASVVVSKSTPQTNPVLNISKTVRNITANGANAGFTESVQARATETVEFQIVVSNSGNATANNVRLNDALPTNPLFTYLSGTLRLNGSASNLDIFGPNPVITNLAPGQSFTITFQSRVPAFTTNAVVTNTATASASNAGTVSDTAQVILVPVLGGNVDLVLSKKAFNNTQNRDAVTVTAKSGDVITYTLTVRNNGTQDATNFVFEDGIADILQLADLTAYAGATYDANAKVLRWPAQTIPANTTVEKTFSVKVKNLVPTNTDYVMTNVFGNTININVERPFVAPPTGAGTTLSIVLAVLSVAGVFLYRRFRLGKINLDLAS